MATAIIPDLLQRIREPFRSLTSSSVNGRIFGAAATIATVTLLVKGAALAKEMVTAWRFGTRDDLDALNVALVVPFAVINIFSASFRAAFLPAYVHAQERADQQTSARLLASGMLWTTGLLAVILLLIVATGLWYLPWLASGFSAEKLRLTFYLLCALSPVILLSGINELWSGVLTTKGSFASVAAVPLITIVLSITLLGLFPGQGIWALVLGLGCGALLESTLLGLHLRRSGCAWRFDWNNCWQNLRTDLRGVIRQAWPLMTGGLVMNGVSVVSVVIVTSFPTGSLSAFTYANKLIALPVALFSTALNTAAAPLFARLSALEEWGSLKQTVKYYLGLIAGITIPITLAIIWLSQSLTALLLQRGAFATQDTQLVATLLSCLALQLPFYIASSFIGQLLVALRAGQVTLFVSFCNLIVVILLSTLFSQELGVKGVALAISAMYFISFLLVYRAATRLLKAR